MGVSMKAYKPIGIQLSYSIRHVFICQQSVCYRVRI